MVGDNHCSHKACKHNPRCLKRCRVHRPHWGAWRRGIPSFSRELWVGGPEVTQASDDCRGEQIPGCKQELVLHEPQHPMAKPVAWRLLGTSLGQLGAPAWPDDSMGTPAAGLGTLSMEHSEPWKWPEQSPY